MGRRSGRAAGRRTGGSFGGLQGGSHRGSDGGGTGNCARSRCNAECQIIHVRVGHSPKRLLRASFQRIFAVAVVDAKDLHSAVFCVDKVILGYCEFALDNRRSYSRINHPSAYPFPILAVQVVRAINID